MPERQETGSSRRIKKAGRNRLKRTDCKLMDSQAYMARMENQTRNCIRMEAAENMGTEKMNKKGCNNYNADDMIN